ncbi:DUF4352 domain-containing protein [Bacillus sp. 1P06AnD]|uniref:DUF4352 domain-containing protein n=1 Tax=Bacillus sp. 1P06AnD TaxID=3132208 RepID=UPI0039A24BF5
MKKAFKFGCLGIIALIIIIVVISLAVGGGDDDSPKKVADNGKTEQKKEKSNEPSLYKVGETVELKDIRLTLNSATFVNANQYSPAEKGKVLEVAFTVTNNGKKQAYFGAEEMKISSADGIQHDQYFGMDNTFMNENINPGKTITGKVYYDVPASPKYELIYTPNFSWDEKNITFELIPQ